MFVTYKNNKQYKLNDLQAEYKNITQLYKYIQAYMRSTRCIHRIYVRSLGLTDAQTESTTESDIDTSYYIIYNVYPMFVTFIKDQARNGILNIDQDRLLLQ